MKTRNDSSIKKTAKEGSHRVGNGIEKIGTKMQQKGYPKAGQKVNDFGDKIEHLGEKNQSRRFQE